MTRPLTIFIVIFAVCGCATPNKMRRELERAAQPKSEQLLQTHFALIGEIVAPEGRYCVAEQRLVITGMLAPRGQAKLLLFDSKRRLAASYALNGAQPLWCENSRVYCWGHGFVWNVPVDPEITARWPDSAEGGNAIDFSRGVHQPYITREKKYGSSGGVEDDPWLVERK